MATCKKILLIARRNESQRGTPQPHLRQMADNSLFRKCSGDQEREWEGGDKQRRGEQALLTYYGEVDWGFSFSFLCVNHFNCQEEE